MTQRDWCSTGGVTEAATRPASGHELLLHPEPTTEPGPARLPRWEELFAQASPAQQHELLALARTQGLLYSHQLPAFANGGASAVERGQSVLLRFLAGKLDNLEPLPAVLPLDWRDNELNAEQREAVARALQTPDLCLIEGVPGTGKSRVVAELVLQAALRGERILLLSTTAAAADRILELVGDADPLCPVRCVEPGETTLPAWSRSLTFRARLEQLRQQPLQAAQQDLRDLDESSHQLAVQEPVYEALQGLLAAAENVRCRLAEVADCGLRIANWSLESAIRNPQSEIGPKLAALDQQRVTQAAEFSTRHESLREQRTRAEQALAGLEPQLAALTVLVEAQRRRQWWRATWWRALFRGKELFEHASLLEHRNKLQSDLAALAEEERQLRHDQEQGESRLEAERRRLIDLEAAQLREALTAQEAAAREELAAIQERWASAVGQLPVGAHRPVEVSAAALEAARTGWHNERRRCEEQRAFSAQWIRCLQETAETLEDRLVGYANLVAGTIAAFRADEHFGDRKAMTFDLLIVQEAEQLTRTDLLQLAPRARRWLLVGEGGSSADGGLRMADSRMLASGVFHHLTQVLQVQANRLPYEWLREPGRLCGRLRPLPAEQRTRLEREPVLDHREIELRIWTAPEAEPQLAEIAFPASYTLAQAKQYVFRELDELAVVPASGGLHWREHEDRVVLQFGAPAAADTESTDLAPGLTDVYYPESTRGQDDLLAGKTARLEFARREGWDRSRAEAFIRQHLDLRELGRTARLSTPQRALPELAAIIADLFGESTGLLSPASVVPSAQVCANGCAALVEFVSVVRAAEKSVAPGRSARRDTPPARAAQQAPKGGAGLEVDLTDRRHRDRLPAELRPGLPEHGFVNYLEALAIVRALEALTASAERGARSAEWQERSALRAPCSAPQVAVIALYPAQALLLRRLVAQSPILAQAPFEVIIDVPEAFREREFPIALVSLTRSHVHRAVAFGDGPRQMVLALTRARNKLILFGDPGTLIRRRQWEGRLEHLTESEAAIERSWVERLVHYLEGTGRHQRLFHLREGSLT